MADQGQLFAFELQGFWMDTGQPKDLLECAFIFSHLSRMEGNGMQGMGL
jgi:NDP-sugar pyrophosphorylase family protein